MSQDNLAVALQAQRAARKPTGRVVSESESIASIPSAAKEETPSSIADAILAKQATSNTQHDDTDLGLFEAAPVHPKEDVMDFSTLAEEANEPTNRVDAIRRKMGRNLLFGKK